MAPYATGQSPAVNCGQ